MASVTLTKGQSALQAPRYRVFQGGTYETGDLVEVYVDDPELPVGQFPAGFIATGEFE